MNLPNLLTVLAIQWAWLPFAIRCWHSNYNQLSTRMHEQSDRSAILNRRADLLWATLGEGGLILVLGAIGWATKQPLIFASLGPTAYELVGAAAAEKRQKLQHSGRAPYWYGCRFFSIYLFNAWTAPNVLSTGIISTQRLWATTLAATLTTLFTLILKAGQPAALATTLLISLGAMQSGRAAIAIVVGVLIMTVIGEPIRLFRLKSTALRQVSGGGS